MWNSLDPFLSVVYELLIQKNMGSANDNSINIDVIFGLQP